MTTAFDVVIFQKGRSHGIDPYLIKAIVAAESNFDPRAYRDEPQIGDASRGLMQLLLGTARWMGYAGPPEGLFDPEVNVEFGTRFLKYLRNYFAGDAGKIISGYNTGPGNVRMDASGRFTNQAYVDRVWRFWMGYRGEKKTEVERQGVNLQPGLPQIGPVPASPQQVTDPAEAVMPADAGAWLASLWTPETAPWILAGVAAIAVVALISGRR